MSKRQRIETPVLPDRSAADEALGRKCLLIAQRVRIATKLDERITDLKEEQRLKIESLEAEEKLIDVQLEAFSERDRGAWQGKSLKLQHGTLSFRDGNPAVKPLKGWTFAAALTAAKSVLVRFVRVKEELDKDGILQDYREKKTTNADLERIGLEVRQDETFGIEPDLDSLSQLEPQP